MKKLIIGLSLCVVSSASMAAANLICSTGTSGPGTQVVGDVNNFVKTSFTPRCSSNTRVDFQQGANSAAAGSISTKGNQVFSGHSNGGAVSGVACAAASGCVESEATTAAETALTAASS